MQINTRKPVCSSVLSTDRERPRKGAIQSMITKAMQQQLCHAMQNPLAAGYVTHSGHVMTVDEAAQYNRYTAAAAKAGNSPQAVEFYLDQRHRWFVLCDRDG